MKVFEKIEDMRGFSRLQRSSARRIAFVPTMGYLHEGHARLLDIGRQAADEDNPGALVLSIFVNPTQFGKNEDFSAYPKSIERDLDMARAKGVDAVFMPGAEQMYGSGFDTRVSLDALSTHLCGLSRPGHFAGVATVVLKLFNIVMPDVAVFGKKDYQQYLIIRKMVQDLNLDIKIIGVETIRETDGLAMSSRNSYLSEPERKAALCVPRSLDEAENLIKSGRTQAGEIIEKMKKIIVSEPLAVLDYIKICDPATLEDVQDISGTVLVAIAARVGRARLIDNRTIGENEGVSS